MRVSKGSNCGFRDARSSDAERAERVEVDDGGDVALLGRFYERFANHAVEVGRRVVFQVTGALPAEEEISTY